MNSLINVINKYANPNDYNYDNYNDYFNIDNLNDIINEMREDLKPFEYLMFSLTKEIEDILLPEEVSLFIIDDYYIIIGIMIDIIYEYQIVNMTLNSFDIMRNIPASASNYIDKRGVIKFYSFELRKLYPNINDKQITLYSLYHNKNGMKTKNNYIYIFNYFNSLLTNKHATSNNDGFELYKSAFQSLLNQFILDDNIVFLIEKKRFLYCVELFLQHGAYLDIDFLINNCIKPYNPNQTIINGNFTSKKREYIFTTFYRFYIIGLLIDEFFTNHISNKDLSVVLNELFPFGNNSTNNIIINYNDILLDKYNWIAIKAFNKPLKIFNDDNMDFFDGQYLLKFEDIKLNVIKYYSKVLSKNYYNSDDNINIDSPFTDWDTYYDMKFRQRFVPYKMLDNQLNIYNQYIVYSSYFFSDFWFKRKEEQSKIFERVDKVYLSSLINKNGLNAQLGYNKFISFLNKLAANELVLPSGIPNNPKDYLALLLLDENGKYIKFNVIFNYIDVFRHYGVSVNINFYKLLYKIRPIIGGKVFVYILHTIVTAFSSR